MKHAKRILRTLDYLPRWAWYTLSFFLLPPFGPVVVYLVFHALGKAAQDEDEEDDQPDWVRAASTYMDDECIVTDDQEVIRQWEETEANARRAAANWSADSQSASQENAPHFEATDGDEPEGDAVEDIIREGNAAMRRIRQANDVISDEALSAQIQSIEDSCGQILSILQQRPQLLGELRTFLRYYLPTTLKLLDARARLERGADTPKAREVRERISDAVSVIDKAFRKQVEALDAYRFIDLESEMDVLRDMLRADGFIDEEPQDDPFADVLRRRRAASAKPAAGAVPKSVPAGARSAAAASVPARSASPADGETLSSR